MIKVYFETKNHAEQIATFENEETCLVCVPALEKWAKANNGFITESCEDEDAISQKGKEFEDDDRFYY